MVALVDNKPDFVELFFNEGINPKQFLTLDRLEHLYVRVSNYLSPGYKWCCKKRNEHLFNWES